jgi:hypothetical protein
VPVEVILVLDRRHQADVAVYASAERAGGGWLPEPVLVTVRSDLGPGKPVGGTTSAGPTRDDCAPWLLASLT